MSKPVISKLNSLESAFKSYSQDHTVASRQYALSLLTNELKNYKKRDVSEWRNLYLPLVICLGKYPYVLRALFSIDSYSARHADIAAWSFIAGEDCIFEEISNIISPYVGDVCSDFTGFLIMTWSKIEYICTHCYQWYNEETDSDYNEVKDIGKKFASFLVAWDDDDAAQEVLSYASLKYDRIEVGDHRQEYQRYVDQHPGQPVMASLVSDERLREELQQECTNNGTHLILAKYETEERREFLGFNVIQYLVPFSVELVRRRSTTFHQNTYDMRRYVHLVEMLAGSNPPDALLAWRDFYTVFEESYKNKKDTKFTANLHNALFGGLQKGINNVQEAYRHAQLEFSQLIYPSGWRLFHQVFEWNIDESCQDWLLKVFSPDDCERAKLALAKRASEPVPVVVLTDKQAQYEEAEEACDAVIEIAKTDLASALSSFENVLRRYSDFPKTKYEYVLDRTIHQLNWCNSGSMLYDLNANLLNLLLIDKWLIETYASKCTQYGIISSLLAYISIQDKPRYLELSEMVKKNTRLSISYDKLISYMNKKAAAIKSVTREGESDA